MDNLEVWITPAILIAGFAFLWQQISGLRRDLDTSIREMRKDFGALTERMARLEGKMDFIEGYITRRNEPSPAE